MAIRKTVPPVSTNEDGSSVRAPRKRRKEARPGELQAAALELFVEKGFAATRLDDHATRLFQRSVQAFRGQPVGLRFGLESRHDSLRRHLSLRMATQPISHQIRVPAGQQTVFIVASHQPRVSGRAMSHLEPRPRVTGAPFTHGRALISWVPKRTMSPGATGVLTPGSHRVWVPVVWTMVVPLVECRSITHQAPSSKPTAR